MKKISSIFVFAISFVLIFAVASFSQTTYVINHLNLEKVGKTIYVTIGATDNIQYNDTMLEEPNRILIDCQNAIDSLPAYTGDLSGTGIISIKSSQYDKEVGLLSPITRITIDLEEKTSYIIMGEQNNLIVAIDAVGFGELEQPQIPPKTQTEAQTETGTEEKELTQEELTPQKVEEYEIPIKPQQEKTGYSKEYKKGEDFIIVEETKKDTVQIDTTQTSEENQTPISLYLVDADIRGILRSMAEFAGVNIVANEDKIKGKVTVILNDIPWREALDIIVKTKGFGIIEEPNGILRVVTQAEVEKEKRKEYDDKQEMERLIPLETKVIKIQYATADEMQNLVEAINDDTGRHNIEVDSRTNSLIITGTPSYIQKVVDLIDQIDTHTPQIVVQAKVISITPNLMKEYGIRWGVSNSQNPSVDSHINADVAPGAIGNSAGAIKLGTLLSGFELDAFLSALEQKGEGEILSEPRITVLDNEQAQMLAGLTRTTTVYDQAGNAVGTNEQNIGVILSVKPHVIANDKVLMELYVEVSSLGGTDISLTNKDNVTTRIIVANNATAVIGGLMRTDRTRTKTSVPVLGKLPLFGRLFRRDTYELQKRELMIFVTPTIVRPPVETQKPRQADL